MKAEAGSAVEFPPRLKELVKGLISASAALTGTVTHAAVGEPLLALTFDDGPDPGATPRLLEILEARGARATFFMVGKSAAGHRELVQRVAAGGHAIGNHSWDHPSLPLLKGRWRRLQIGWCREALAPYGSRLFRPPYGHQTPASQLDAVRMGATVVTWSVNAEDWRDDPAEKLLERVRRRLRPGSIVLFHDALYAAFEERYRDRGPTLEAVTRLLEEEGGRYSFVTVPELLRRGRPRKRHWYQRPDLEVLHKAR